jgi:hypothetical protein
MKDRLTAIFNLMQRIETKGDSTLFMADCIRELANVINSMPEESAPAEQPVE